MEKGKSRRVAVAVAVVVVMVGLLMCKTEAQDTSVATCASSLTTCASYLNATQPPSSCCDPLKQALATQKECLCNLLVNNTSLLKSFHVNLTDALSLPYRCNLTGSAATASTNICTASPPSASTTNTTSSTASGKNDADIVAWSGVSIVLAVMASLILY